MEVAKIRVHENCAVVIQRKTVTSGMVGATVSFEFDESWEGLTRTAVYKCGGIIHTKPLSGDVGTIPAEVIARSGWPLEIGVCGTNADKVEVIPTVYAEVGKVRPGADPSGDPAADPELPFWAQILALIDAITTSKVSVTDIIDNLVTNVANKPLSAAQGVILKGLIEELRGQIPEGYTLPVATETVLGGVKAAAATEEMTQPVGITEDGKLVTAPGQNSGQNANGGGVSFETDDTLTLKDGVLSVNTTDQMEQDNTLPITSAGVYATVGNIEALLKTI